MINLIDNLSFNNVIGISILNNRNINCTIHTINAFISNNTVVYKNSMNQGVSLNLEYYGNFYILNSIFLSNEAKNGGNSCINYIKSEYNSIIQSNLFISNSSFSFNKAELYSSCIIFSGDYLEIKTVTFFNNIGKSFGVLYLNTYQGYLDNIILKNCIAPIGSTIVLVLILKDTNILLNKLFLIENSGEKALFYLFTLYPFNCTITNSYFNENSVKGQGGVFYVEYFDGDSERFLFYILKSFFSNNYAKVSGGVGEFSSIAGYFEIYKTIFINNSASEGGVFNINTEIITLTYIHNSIFISNKAKIQGGAFYVSLANFTLYDSEFYFHQCDFGSIFVTCSYTNSIVNNISIKNSYNKNNLLGNIVLFAKSTNELSNIIISNSTSISCAGIVISGLTLTNLNNISFFNNTAEKSTLILVSYCFNIININNIFGNFNKALVSNLISFIFSLGLVSNIFIKNSIGTGIYCEQSIVNLSFIYYTNHFCLKYQKGCFLDIEGNSILFVESVKLKNVSSNEPDGIIFIIASKTEFYHCIFDKIKTIRQADVLFSEMSYIFLKDIYIINFVNSAIFVNSNKDVKILGLYCENPNLFSYACVNITNTNKININHSIFFFISETSVIIYDNMINLNNNTHLIENCLFYHNKIKLNGGGLSLMNINFNLNICFFVGNKGNRGGALYLSSIINKNFNHNLNNCTFINNSADLTGGAIFWDFNIPLVNFNVFENNFAKYGNNIASTPVKLRPNHSAIEINNIISGSYLINNTLNLSLFDYYNNKVIELDRNEVPIATLNFINIYNNKLNNYKSTINENYKSIVGTNLADFYLGDFIFPKIIVLALPDNIHTMAVFSSNIIQNNKSLINDYSVNDVVIENNYYFVFNVSFRYCPLGYIFNNQINSCRECGYGEYSISLLDENCLPCPDHAICSGGKDININSGYWRESLTSIEIYKCKIEKACLGGINSICAEGFNGILCDSCIFDDREIYFKNVDENCYKCENTVISYLVISLFIVILIIYQLYTIKIKMKSIDFRKSCIMKILLNYFQLVSVVNILNANMTNDFTKIFKYQSQTSNPKQTLYSMNCIYAIFKTKLNIFVINSVFICSFSIIYPILFIFFVFLYSIFKKHIKEKRIYNVKISLLIVCYTLQPFFLNYYFNAFNCLKIGNNSYLQDYLSQECWNTVHSDIIIYLILPFLIFWLFVLPIFSFITIYINSRKKNKNVLIISINSKKSLTRVSTAINNENLPNPFSFITDGYDELTYYWEFVIMLYKMIIIAIVTFITDVFLIAILLFFFYFLFTSIQIFMKPYKTHNLNFLQLYGYIVALSTIFLSFCTLNTESFFQRMFLVFVIAIINSWFLFVWAYNFLLANKSSLLKMKKILSFLYVKLKIFKRKLINIF